MWRRISWRHIIYQMDEVLVRYRVGHPSMMQRERKRYLDDLRHFAKMRHDTPRHLRSELPSAITFILPRMVGMLAPGWLLRRLHRLRPRTRWIQFRQWLGPRMRWNGLR